MDMMKMMKQAASMQKDMKKKQKMLSKKMVEYTTKNGQVTATASCDIKVQSIKIEPDLVNPAEIKKLELAILDAVKGAINMAQNEAASEMKSLTKGMDLPF
ncbi:MAG: YbaB/EbfC family nucleoid-associated protein [Kiritimatiellaceae bacterium]|nr:YbaB/EbfC family nucleoid-associated protein [Kiritimatiellaceae bacterium]